MLVSALMPPVKSLRHNLLNAGVSCKTATPDYAWKYSVLVLKLLQLSVSTLRMILLQARTSIGFSFIPPLLSQPPPTIFLRCSPSLCLFICIGHAHMHCCTALHTHFATHTHTNTHTTGMRACQHSPSVSTHSAEILLVQTTG